jgi:hypothetical protein
MDAFTYEGKTVNWITLVMRHLIPPQVSIPKLASKWFYILALPLFVIQSACGRQLISVRGLILD